MLMGAHDACVQHHVFVVAILGQHFENTPKNAALAPATEALMGILPTAEPLRQVSPRNTRPVTVEHGLDEKTIVRCRSADVSLAARQKIFYPLPLIVS